MKSLLKNTITPFFASQPVSAIAELVVQAGVPIFMFHRFHSAESPIHGHNPDYLRRCLNYLIEHGYTFISVEQIVNAIQNHESLPKRAIAFTLDDGFLDQATVAAPVFIEYQCPVTIFLISGFLDGKLWPWDDQVAYLIKQTQQQKLTIKLADENRQFDLHNKDKQRQSIHDLQNWIKRLDATQISDYLATISHAAAIKIPEHAPLNYQPMSWDQARVLEKKGVCFAPHTISHRILSRLNDDHAENEITGSWQRLQHELSSPCPVFCYPTGRQQDFTHREIDIIKQAGLTGAVSTEATHVNPNNDTRNYRFKLPRFGFPCSYTDFIQYSSWIERAKTQILRR